MSETKPISNFTDEHLAIARETLHNNEFAKMIGMNLVEMRPAEATIEIEMRDQLRQPHGLLHGGVTATLIDTAMAFAVITVLTREEKASTVDLNVHYLRPHTEGKFFCTARIVKAGKRLLTVSAEVVNEQGKLIATALSTYTKV
jgi:acyl-CoA thioesterase